MVYLWPVGIDKMILLSHIDVHSFLYYVLDHLNRFCIYQIKETEVLKVIVSWRCIYLFFILCGAGIMNFFYAKKVFARENPLQFILPLCVVMSEHQGRCRFFDLLLECSEGYVVMKSTVELCLPLNTLFDQTLLDFRLVYDLNKPYTGSSHVLFLFVLPCILFPCKNCLC